MGMRGWRRLALALALSMLAWALSMLAWAAAAGDGGGAPALEVFVRDGCPHCADAKVFLRKLSAERPGLRIVYRQVDVDEAARDDLVRHFRAAGS